MKRAWTPVNDMQKKPVQLVKPYPLVIGRGECSSNLWGYLCERYGVNPADTVQLVLTEPSRLAEAYRQAGGRTSRA